MSSAAHNDPAHRSGVWDAVAADYAALAEPFTRRYAEAALQLAGGVAPGEAVLDVAAGTGALTIAAARAGARVLATDFSPGMVALLADRLRAGGFDRTGCEARVMDGQALDLPAGRLDSVFSVFGVMLFPDHLRGLAEMARVLRPGGRGVCVAWARGEGAGPAVILVEAFRALFPDRVLPPFPAGMTRLCEPRNMVEDMERAGFVGVRVETVAGTWTAPSARWVTDNFGRLFRQSPLYTGLGEPDHRRLRDAIGARLASFGSGEVRIPALAHVGLGRRGDAP